MAVLFSTNSWEVSTIYILYHVLFSDLLKFDMNLFRITLNEKAGFIIRQYVKYSVYDRYNISVAKHLSL